MSGAVPRGRFLACLGASIFLTYPLIKKAAYPDYPRKANASEKTIILTGATGNLGTAVAMNLAKRHCRLIMACRNMEKCKGLRRELVMLTANHNITCKRLNLEDIDSIVEFANDVIDNEPHIDTLINLASVRELPEKELTKYGIEKHFWINFLAPYLLTFKLLSKLKESAKTSKDSRVVNVTGAPTEAWKIDPNDINFDKRLYSGKEAYRQSKLALAHFTMIFNKFYEPLNVRAFGVAPADKISPMLVHKLTAGSQLMAFLSTWTRLPANNASGTTVLCAVDDKILKDYGGGGLFQYFFEQFGRNQGWGAVGKNDMDAQLTWNLAANMLLELPSRPKSDFEKLLNSNKETHTS